MTLQGSMPFFSMAKPGFDPVLSFDRVFKLINPDLNHCILFLMLESGFDPSFSFDIWNIKGLGSNPANPKNLGIPVHRSFQA